MRARLQALGEVFRNPGLRRLQIAWGCFYTGEWASVVALSVYAYNSGGAKAVGFVGFIRMLPAALAVPFAAVAADRLPRERVLLAVHSVRAAALGAATLVLLAHGPAPAVYLLAAVAALASSAFRPAQWALVPALARTPQELVAANVSAATFESGAAILGPGLAAAILAVRGPVIVFGFSSAVFAAAALLVAGISSLPRAERAPAPDGEHLLGEALAGFRTLADEPDPRLLIGLFGAQTLVRGFLNVLIVLAAIELLGMGDSGVGVLNAAFGVGGFLGAFAGLSLVDRRALARPFGLGLVLWGAPIAVVGLVVSPAVALVALAVVGSGNSVLDVAGFTMVQRSVRPEVLGRVFGVLETCAIAGVGIGALVTPFLVDALGLRSALVVVGALLPALAIAFQGRLSAMDARAGEPPPALALLRSIPLFAPLPTFTLEQVAARAVPVEVRAGGSVVREGDPGQNFYAVAEGALVVTIGGVEQRVLGPGDSFGEIALLRNVPRTATVTATSDAKLYALDAETFVPAVTGNPIAASAAEEAVTSQLGAARVPTAPL